jgi:flagellar L-ring protein FlgH
MQGAIKKLKAVVSAAAVWAGATAGAEAQSSSLYGPPEGRPPLTLAESSWVYLAVPPVREIQLNDIFTVLVTESSQLLSEGNIQRRTQANLNADLENFVKLQHLNLEPTAMSQGNPQIQGVLNSQLRTTSQLDTQSSVKFKMAVRVVDIRPNGTLVVEGHKKQRVGDEVWEGSLSGLVRREDILPNNTVLSEDISELMVDVRESGQIRDAYKQGWFLKFLDRYKPF